MHEITLISRWSLNDSICTCTVLSLFHCTQIRTHEISKAQTMSYIWVLTLSCLVTSTLCQMDVVDETENDSRISKMSEAIGRLESMVADLMTDNRKLKKLTSELARCLKEERRLRKRNGGQGHGIILQSWERGSRTDIGGEIPEFEASPKSTQKRAGKLNLHF